MNDKINAKHLERAAYVYIRQSSLQQVRQNVESGRRQYALQDRARELGFARIVLDTLSEQMAEAVALYRSMGFREGAPYLPEPTPGALCLELPLR